jgi:hypothetical protein
VPRLHVYGGTLTVPDGELRPVPPQLVLEARRAVDDPGVSDAAFRALTRAALRRLDDPAASATRDVRLRVATSWQPAGGVVTVGVQGVDRHGDALPGVGGPQLDLDWSATNDLARAAVTARDGAWGVPVRAEAYP